eukprot:scaffold7738_cov133-Cylindrotheca_fusiformis.AAC.4
MRQKKESTQDDSMNSLSEHQLSICPATPMLPGASLDKAERKRARSNAIYYSECSLRGIKPVHADAAATQAQGKYEKWWVKTRATGRTQSSLETPVSFPRPSQPSRKRKADGEDSSLGIVTAESSDILSSDDRNVPHTSQDSKPPCVDVAHISTFSPMGKGNIDAVKTRLIRDLKSSGGSVETKDFKECLDILSAYYKSTSWDGRGIADASPFTLNGSWRALSKPTYAGCKGRNKKGEYLYSLGALSFDMFTPTSLVCSIQGSFNHIHPIDPKTESRPLYVPRKLMKEIQRGDTNLRAYDIKVALTIEASQDRTGVQKSSNDGEYTVPRPIKAILTNQGYTVPDPTVPNRLSIWFSGGSLECLDQESDLEEWEKLFDSSCAPNPDLREYANILAAKLLLGALLPEEMNEDGTVSFALKRPIGGHGCAFCDILYLDSNLRITRGHHGSVYVFTKCTEPDSMDSAPWTVV